MITFTDGTEMSWEEAAVKIEAEGRVIADLIYWNEGGRCSVAIIGNYQGPCIWDRQLERGIHDRISDESELFKGTPEERAVYMAAWCRKQGNLDLANRDETQEGA